MGKTRGRGPVAALSPVSARAHRHAAQSCDPPYIFLRLRIDFYRRNSPLADRTLRSTLQTLWTSKQRRVLMPLLSVLACLKHPQRRFGQAQRDHPPLMQTLTGDARQARLNSAYSTAVQVCRREAGHLGAHGSVEDAVELRRVLEEERNLLRVAHGLVLCLVPRDLDGAVARRHAA